MAEMHKWGGNSTWIAFFCSAAKRRKENACARWLFDARQQSRWHGLVCDFACCRLRTRPAILDTDGFVAIYRSYEAETLRSFKGRNAQFEHK
jgi:hypothetical protein